MYRALDIVSHYPALLVLVHVNERYVRETLIALNGVRMMMRNARIITKRNSGIRIEAFETRIDRFVLRSNDRAGAIPRGSVRAKDSSFLIG